MSKREQKKEEYKSQLIEAAFQSIVESGLSGANVHKISQKAGVSTGNIHYHFGGKDGLLLEVLKFLLNTMRVPVRKNPQEANDPLSRLMAYISAQFNSQVYTNNICIVWLNYWNASTTQENFARLERINRKRLQSNLRSLLGQILDRETTSMAAYDIHALIDGLWIHKAIREEGPTSEQAIASVWRLVESYIQKKKPESFN